MTKDPLRVTELPAEGNRSNRCRRRGRNCQIQKEIPDLDKDRAACRKPYFELVSSAVIVPGQRDKAGIYIYQFSMYLPHAVALRASLTLDDRIYHLYQQKRRAISLEKCPSKMMDICAPIC